MSKILVESQVKERRSHFLSIMIILFGFFLHQSAQTGLGNLSIVDFLLVVFFIYMIINQQISIKKSHLIIILFFLSFISFVSVFYTPLVFNISISGSRFIAEMIKLVALFAFFFIGIELVKRGLINKLLTVYSYSGLIIAIIGIVISLLNIPLFNEILFKNGSRLNGLMNDPNYFAILQITTLPYFIKKTNINSIQKISIIIIIILSIILSGSKTGLLALGVYLLFIFFEKNVLSPKKRTVKSIMKNILLLVIFSFGLFIFFSNFSAIINWFNFYFPVTNRLTSLFTDFDAAVASGGSGRDVAWQTGIEIIKASPLFGIGVGNYSTIGNKYFGSGVIAHNTYLQLASEWSLILTIIFFGGIFLLILAIIRKKNSFLNLSIQKDILVIFLIGSMGISLNNARFFWLILGATLTQYGLTRKEKTDYKK